MKTKEINDLALYQDAVYFTYLFGKAVKEAKETNRRHGLPNDFVLNGQRYYELPNGQLTTQNPLAGPEELI
jgi:hypothetical protein